MDSLTKDRVLEVGDVVMSPEFSYCTNDSTGMLVYDLHVKWGCQKSKPGFKKDSQLWKFVDLSRADAKFVVVSKRYKWEVLVRRLNDDDSYNPDGELIMFSENDDSSWRIRVNIVGRMTMFFK